MKKKKKYVPKPKIEFDKDGWAMVSEYKPERYDLVRVKNIDGKEQMGWYDGHDWQYGIKKIRGEPISWKRLPRGYEFYE